MINALTGQPVAVVSEVAGTTTDPVYTSLEIHGIGPCVLVDTAGFDDEGDLGALRVEQTEKALQTGLNAMLQGRTSFIIAHRLSTIRGCDRIMYIDDGGIMETGSHEELMAKKGYYYKLYTAQLEEVHKTA